MKKIINIRELLVNKLHWGIGIFVCLLLLVAGLERMAAERVEVVELHTTDESGEDQTTRLWIVDDEGFQYLRVGADGSGWFNRILSSNAVKLTRNGETIRYRTVLREDKSNRINALMQAKYSWSDTYIGALVGGRDDSIPIELHPLL